MELDTSYKEIKNVFKQIKLKSFLISAISIILIAAIVTTLVLKLSGTSKAQVSEQRTTKVAKGNINVTVTGSGPINSSNELQVTSSVNGKITKIYFKEGDTVKEGDILFELDDSDAKLNVDKIKNSIAQTQLSVNSNLKSLNSLDLRAPFNGQITNIASLKVGDDVMKGATVFTITDLSELKLQVSFSGAIINEVNVGEKVTVNIQDLMQSVEGVVTYVSTVPTSTSTGGNIYDVEIRLNNPGSLKAGMSANVEIATSNDSQTSINTGKLEYVNTQIVKSEAGGTVTSINIKENQYVKAGQSLIRLNNDDLEISSQTTDLKLQDLNTQLATAEKQLLEYKIHSPISGVIVSLDLKTGNSVKPADVLTTITDPGHMEFEIPIDELDIAKIKIGQKANITVDALTETTSKPLTGQVSKIAIEGSSSNGVTTYPVTIQVNETENLKVGMNANAEIIISEKSDVLVVPLEAVQKMGNRSFVMVKSDGQNQGNTGLRNNRNTANSNEENTNQNRSDKNNNSNGNSESNSNTSAANRNNRAANVSAGGARANSALSKYYENAIMKPVEVGINNDEYIEIISGLQEGEEVILPQLSTGTTQTTQQIGAGGFGIPGMGGGNFGGQRASGSTQQRDSSRK